MTEEQFEKLKIGNIVTKNLRSGKSPLLRVIGKTEGIPGLWPGQVKAEVVNSDDFVYLGQKRVPSKVTQGSFRCFKLWYANAPKDIKALQRRHLSDPTRKLTPAWEYYLEAYEKSKKNFDKTTAWNRIRLLTCNVYGVSQVKDIPDALVPEAIECANSFTDHFIEWNTKESKQ